MERNQERRVLQTDFLAAVEPFQQRPADPTESVAARSSRSGGRLAIMSFASRKLASCGASAVFPCSRTTTVHVRSLGDHDGDETLLASRRGDYTEALQPHELRERLIIADRKSDGGRMKKNKHHCNRPMTDRSGQIHFQRPMQPSPEVVAYEAQYRLPSLLGTPNQIGWACNRHQILTGMLPKIIEASAGMGPQEAKALFKCVDNLRNHRDARHWIEEVRQHRGDGVEYVLSLPAKAAAERERLRQIEMSKLERLQRATEGRKLAKEADAYAAQYSLPRMLSAAGSHSQESLGRRCRHELLTALSEVELSAILPLIRHVNDPCVWNCATPTVPAGVRSATGNSWGCRGS